VVRRGDSDGEEKQQYMGNKYMMMRCGSLLVSTGHEEDKAKILTSLA
jgi:hypothetical protein